MFSILHAVRMRCVLGIHKPLERNPLSQKSIFGRTPQLMLGLSQELADAQKASLASEPANGSIDLQGLSDDPPAGNQPDQSASVAAAVVAAIQHASAVAGPTGTGEQTHCRPGSLIWMLC